VASKSATWADGPAVGLTGSVSAMSLSPGMQTSLHSSHSALPASVMRLPAGTSAGTWIVVSSRISPSYPKLTRGPVGRRFGCGHSMGPAVKPAGNFHSMRVGRPESPGTCQ